MNKIEKKRIREQEVVTEMISLYCRKNHQSKKGILCSECRQLCDYAVARSECCPFMENKTFCVNCKVHCYKPEMREKIRAVMKYSGPKIVFYHPIMALWHLVSSKREKRKMKEEN